MKNYLQKTLFVGLGGAGIKSIVGTKKIYQDKFTAVPPMIGFLGIDTDSCSNDTNGLESNEFVRISVSEPRQLYESHKEAFSWLPEQQLRVLVNMNFGAGQTRTNGRFALTANYEYVEKALLSTINKINAPNEIEESEQWKLDDGRLQVYVVFSLSGGTGSGTFINIAYMLRKLLGDNCELHAVAIAPGIYYGPCGNRIGPNGFYASMELDYLMTSVNEGNPFSISLQPDGHIDVFTEAPFDNVIVIDNNSGYTKLTSTSVFYSFVSNALFSQTCTFISAIQSQRDNISMAKMNGYFDVCDKKAWIESTGSCKLSINSGKLTVRQSFSKLTENQSSAKSITELYQEMSESEKKDVLKTINAESAPLIEINEKGFLTDGWDYMFISMKDPYENTITNDECIKKAFDSLHPTLCPSASDKEIEFLKIGKPRPLFQIQSLMRYGEDYEKNKDTQFYGIDKGLSQILDTAFSIFPNHNC